MATTAKALGAVGCVSDGGLRDLAEIRQLGGFQLFCPGFVVSHGYPVVCEVGVDVELNGLKVRPGDLLHGDLNGILVVPDEIADHVPAEAEKVCKYESHIMNFVRSPDFSLAALMELQEKFRH